MFLPPGADATTVALSFIHSITNPLAAFYSQHVTGFYVLQQYIAVACLSVLIWDILNSLHDDYRLITEYKFTKVSFVFVFTRVATLLLFIFHVLASNAGFISLTQVEASKAGSREAAYAVFPASQAELKAIMWTGDILYVLSRSSTGLLLYFRATAVYDNGSIARILFGIFWLALVALYLVTMVPIYNVVNTPPDYNAFFTAMSAVELVNDLTMLLAISLKLRIDDELGSGGNGWRNIFILRRQGGMRHLAAAFLQDTQVFYLIVVCTNLLTFIAFLASRPGSFSVDDYGDTFLAYPQVLITHLMATKIHRNLKLGKPGLLGGQKSTFGLGALDFVEPAAEGRNGAENPDSTSSGRRRGGQLAARFQSTISRILAGSGTGGEVHMDSHVEAAQTQRPTGEDAAEAAMHHDQPGSQNQASREM